MGRSPERFYPIERWETPLYKTRKPLYKTKAACVALAPAWTKMATIRMIYYLDLGKEVMMFNRTGSPVRPLKTY